MGNGPYQLVTEIPIGGEGGWDILTIDSAAQPALPFARDQGCCGRSGEKCGRRRNRRHAWRARVCRRAGSGARLFVERQGEQIERGRSKNAEDNFENRYRENPDAIVYDPKHGEVYVFNHTEIPSP